MSVDVIYRFGRPGLACLALAGTIACSQSSSQPKVENPPVNQVSNQTAKPEPKTASASPADNPATETVTFGAGCYWCVEAVFQQLKGVESVQSGFSGGLVENPTYQDVCTGTTGHAEVCQITYRPDVISFEELLEVFWKTHDPTTLNRQGADVGTQYRSAIFYHNEKQKALAEEYKKKLNESGVFPRPIVTEITPYKTFFKADDYHQNYFRDNPSQGYCRAVIVPKVEKFKQVFADKLKSK